MNATITRLNPLHGNFGDQSATQPSQFPVWLQFERVIAPLPPELLVIDPVLKDTRVSIVEGEWNYSFAGSWRSGHNDLFGLDHEPESMGLTAINPRS